MKKIPLVSIIAIVVSTVLTACTESVVTGPLIADATESLHEPIERLAPETVANRANTAEVTRFSFLPPMVRLLEFNGTFDSSYQPVVRIFELDGETNLSPPLAEFRTFTGPGSETIRVDEESEHYIVNWHSRGYHLDPANTYRINV